MSTAGGAQALKPVTDWRAMPNEPSPHRLDSLSAFFEGAA